MFRIGEFSRATGLSVKTLRFYHETGLLVPARVDAASGYRLYDERNLEKAQVITALRRLGFSLEEIGRIVAGHDDQSDILDFLERQKTRMRERVRREVDIVSTLERIIESEKEARKAMKEGSFDVQEKEIDPMVVAGIRMRGRYSDCGKGFADLGKRVGRWIGGKPLCLHYDCEYREDDADFETCFPLRKSVAVDGVSVRELPGGRFVSLLHRGPYEELGRSYARALKYAEERGYELLLPTREVYIKGPGMIFRGNPRKYLTEILLPVETRAGKSQSSTS
jgi:DNA-binding transcriptional MerR regulator/effector-binding domain-containing protein